MRRLYFLMFILFSTSILGGCRCADGERPRLFPRLFHRDDCDDDDRFLNRRASNEPNRRGQPCNNFLDAPIAPASYGPHAPINGMLAGVQPGMIYPSGTFPGGTFSGPFQSLPSTPGSMITSPALPPGGGEELPRLPPRNVPLAAPNNPTDPN